jgi:hypothetical protein
MGHLMIEVKGIKSANVFISEIEELKKKGYDSYIDVIIDYCSKNGMDVETAASMLKSSTKMKSILQKEAESINMLPKSDNLGI